MSELPIEIDAAAVKRLLDDSPADGRDAPVVLDVREPDEYEVASISGSRLIPMSEIQQRLDELEPLKDQHIVVHCHHGGRSLRVTEFLRQQGFPSVQNMTGGIDVWSTDIDPSVPRY